MDEELIKTPRDIIALYWQNIEFGADKGITEAEAITAIVQLIKQARNNEIEALVTHIQDKFEEVEVLLNEYQYVRTRAIDKEGSDDENRI